MFLDACVGEDGEIGGWVYVDAGAADAGGIRRVWSGNPVASALLSSALLISPLLAMRVAVPPQLEVGKATTAASGKETP